MATDTENPDLCAFAVAASASSATVRLDTKGFCIFCLKRGYQDPPVTTQEDAPECKVDIRQLETEAQLRQQFSRVISRYLGTKFAFLNAHQNDQDQEDKSGFLNKRFEAVPEVDVSVICKDCSILVEGICHLFHEMKKLEIALDWKARQLKNIMAFAKRAPTRVKIFRERFSDSGTPEDMEALERVEMFRKEILEKCSSKFRKVQPRIIFKRRGDSLSKRSSRRKNAEKMVQNITLHDAEVQTDPISIEPDRPLKLQSQRTNDSSKKNKRRLDNDKSCVSEDDHVKNYRDAGTYNESKSPSPPPLSPANSGGPSVSQEEEDDSQCFLRIRTIESLASPTKSVSEESPPVRQTRSFLRRLLPENNPTSGNNTTDKVVLDDDKLSVSTRRANGPVLNSVPDIAPSLSTPTPSSTNSKINDLTSRKATLTEWLQSTFNCDKCNKMFISEATLSVHKTTCGIEDIRRAEESVQQGDDESMEFDDNNGDGDEPMYLSHAEDSSEEEQEDPLGEATEDPKQAEEEDTAKNPDDLSETEKPCNKTFTTIRILTNNTVTPTSSPSSPIKKSTASNSAKTRYCKYCKARYSTNHFMRHRQTLKHKQCKRIHKKAKKMGNLTNPTSKISTNIPAATTGHITSSNAVVTVSREENNVKVVKIIYVAKNGTTVGDNQEENSSNNNNGASEKGNETVVQTHANEVIDISDD